MIPLSFIVANRKSVSGCVRSCAEGRDAQEVESNKRKHGSEFYHDL